MNSTTRTMLIQTGRTTTLGQSSKSLFLKRNQNSKPIPQYKPIKVVGQGVFGIVYTAKTPDGELVAIKKVLQTPKYINREIEILEELNNEYCVHLKNYFTQAGKRSNEVILYIVMDFLPMSIHQFNFTYRKENRYPPLIYVKLFAFELFSGLYYLHKNGITHRDIKPQNILCDPTTGELKICDFGSAKKIIEGEKSVSYIASRYYRAPELFFGCVYYTSAVDIWAAGCVIFEILTGGKQLFVGESSKDQLFAIAKIIGSPTEEDLKSFQHYHNIQLDVQKETPLNEILPGHTPQDLYRLLTDIFVYNPEKRPTAFECLQHPFFDDLFELVGVKMPSSKPFPNLNRNPPY